MLLFPSELFSQQQECFLLMVGKDASANGQVLLAHNNDLSGNEASMLLKVPANEMLNILPDSSVSYNQPYEMLILQTNIGFAEGDAVAINKQWLIRIFIPDTLQKRVEVVAEFAPIHDMTNSAC